MISDNADREFEVLWKMNRQTGRPISELSDLLSEKIVQITVTIEESELFEDEKLRKAVLKAFMPKILVSKVGMPELERRIPISYQKAIFARYLASTFIYQHGIEAGYEDYRRFIATFPAAGS